MSLELSDLREFAEKSWEKTKSWITNTINSRLSSYYTKQESDRQFENSNFKYGTLSYPLSSPTLIEVTYEKTVDGKNTSYNFTVSLPNLNNYINNHRTQDTYSVKCPVVIKGIETEPQLFQGTLKYTWESASSQTITEKSISFSEGILTSTSSDNFTTWNFSGNWGIYFGSPYFFTVSHRYLSSSTNTSLDLLNSQEFKDYLKNTFITRMQSNKLYSPMNFTFLLDRDSASSESQTVTFNASYDLTETQQLLTPIFIPCNLKYSTSWPGNYSEFWVTIPNDAGIQKTYYVKSDAYSITNNFQEL